MVYSAQEKAKCVEMFIEEGKSVANFGVRYRRELVIHAKVPDRNRILDWYIKFKGQGSVERKKRPNIKTVRMEEKTAEVIDFFKAKPHSSVCWAANVEGMPSRRSIQRILKEADFHPYKLQMHQELKQVDRDKRVERAVQMLDLIRSLRNSPRILIRSEWEKYRTGI